MPRHDIRQGDDSEWDGWDDDLPEEAHEPATVACPYCAREIAEAAERCPHCGQYISEEDRPSRPKPWWVWLGVVVCLYVVYRWTFG
jgi:hypothetical protein